MAFWNFWKERKTVPPVGAINEETRNGIHKSYIPRFMWKPPFGYPRYVDLVSVRRLARMPYVEMCISTILDEVCSIPWDIVPKEGKEDSPTAKKHIEEIKNFYDNPNTNKESFEKIRRKYLRDILEVDAGVINKVFNQSKQMVEISARPGDMFTKNPDIYGFFTDREDFIDAGEIFNSNKIPTSEMGNPEFINLLTPEQAREDAAYFQYGWSAARPVPFGKREIVWMERNPRSDDLYGRSPIQNLADTIQTLIYSVEHNLEYFNDNSIPKGVLGLEGSDSEEIEAFKTQWEEQQRVRDTAGNWKKKFHNMPIVGKTPSFTRFELTNAELELLEGQKWWAKMVWASFGVTSVELGYTEDAKGLANQIVQSNIFKKRAIYPILRIEEYAHNQEIISEFEFDDVEFKFLLFDVEEETKKAQLFQVQLTAGYKSINEIRLDEGMEEVDWGEKQSAEEMMEMQSKYTGNPGENGEMRGQEPDDKKKSEKKKEELGSKEKKSFEDNPLILRPNEVPDESRLEKSIIYLLKENEKKIKSLIEKEMGDNKLMQIKSLESLSKAIKGMLSFVGIKAISDKVIQVVFMKGWDSAEKQVERNLIVNQGAVSFIQDYTFENIKGMTEDIANKLRQELERGIIEGEGITKIKARVGKVFDVGENRAEMIARTETNRAEGQGKLQAFKSSGVKLKKKWDTHFDDRTSPICKRLHGQVVGINENFKDNQTGWEGTTHPAHVNCRSSVLYVTEEEEKETKARKLEIEKMQKDLEEKEVTLEEKRQNVINRLADTKSKENQLVLDEKQAKLLKRKEDLLNKLEKDANE